MAKGGAETRGLESLRIMGAGGFGTVYELDEETALKVINVGDDENKKDSALEEVEFMLKIMRQRGPGREHILSITGYKDLGDRVYVYMPLAEFSMSSFIQHPKYHKVELSKKSEVLTQCFNGLSFLHSRDPVIIHQDIKTQNVLLFKGLTAKLCDFGLSRYKSHATATMLSDRGTGGTVPYMGPEVLVGVPGKGKLKPQPATDVYAMCCAGVEWLTGSHVWTYSGYEDYKKQVKRKLKNHQLPEQLQQVPEPWATMLTRGLVHDHTQRPTAAAIRDSLASVRMLRLEMTSESLASSLKSEDTTASGSTVRAGASGISSRDSGKGSSSSTTASSDVSGAPSRSKGSSVRQLKEQFERSSLEEPKKKKVPTATLR